MELTLYMTEAKETGGDWGRLVPRRDNIGDVGL